MKNIRFLLVILLSVYILTGCSQSPKISVSSPVSKSALATAKPTSTPVETSKSVSNEKTLGSGKTTDHLKAHFIEVGQGDSILVQMPNRQNLLIDAGPNDATTTVISYIKARGIKTIDYVVATHPHEDHIGGLDTVISAFNIGKVYIPKITSTTRTFEDVVSSIKEKGLKISEAKAGVSLVSTPNLKVVMVAPVGPYHEDINNWSTVIRIQYGATSFLLTGDAEAQSESEMLVSGQNLKADVLKVGHHGSSSSTLPGFLKAVNPKYAVISVGAGNDYGHPHQETLDKLAAAKITVYRTDLNGSIIALSDGSKISFQTFKSSVQLRAPTTLSTVLATPTKIGEKYIGNKNTKKFHYATCSYAAKISLANRIYFTNRKAAIAASYAPCKVCKP